MLNGSIEAQKIFKRIKNQKNKIGLAAVLVGNDPASKVYINIKNKTAKKLNINFKKYLLSSNTSEKKILNLINKLNNDKNIHGILVQLPLPKKFKNSTNKIIKNININKDIDGFNNPKIIPPTIQAIIHLVKISKIKLANKKAVILANSHEFAEPQKKELIRKKIKTNILLKKDLRDKFYDLRKFDIVVIAFGKRWWFKPDMIKKNSIIIDVGINRIKNCKKIFGDVHPDCFKKSKYISPVPGGVGPLTVAFLFKNLLRLYKLFFRTAGAGDN